MCGEGLAVGGRKRRHLRDVEGVRVELAVRVVIVYFRGHFHRINFRVFVEVYFHITSTSLPIGGS